MNFGSVIFEHNIDNRKTIRSIESLSKKLYNAKAALTFNKQCELNNLLPAFTNIHLNDEAVQQRHFTLEFRRNLVKNEIEAKTKRVQELEEELARQQHLYRNLNISEDLRRQTDEALSGTLDLHAHTQESHVQKKLCNLYGGWVPLPKLKDGYVNLSDVALSEDQKELLNLGTKYALTPKYSNRNKKAELEILYQDICKLKTQNKILVNPDLQDQLKAESTKSRSGRSGPSLEPRLQRAAKELRNNDNLVIRRADKSQVFVILNKKDYDQKVSAILGDQTKFTKITRNPVEQLKRSANDLIDVANKASKDHKIDKIIGDYQPGYFYGNVKTHKQDNPLRPIISQIPLPIYQLAKTLNRILRPYVPLTYSLKSSSEFIDLLKNRTRRGSLASLDVSSLFTNVPVERTIAILAKYVYHHATFAAPDIPENVMCAMLRLCTTKAPFRCPNGNLYYQTDGIAMGSPLGVLFAEAFMASVEETVLNGNIKKPTIYCRYVDDILVEVCEPADLEQLKLRLEEVSGLSFTIEHSVADTISFLDVSIDAADGHFSTTVFRKPTDEGRCLHGKSQCPQRYKDSVVKAYIHRALKHCSTWLLFHQEVERIKQVLVDNEYDLATIDQQIRTATDKYHAPTKTTEDGNTISLFYKSQMTSEYKTEEAALKKIISRNCKPVEALDKIKLNIYYQSPTVSSFILKNNPNKDTTPLKQCNVVYRYKCQTGDCAILPNSGYIGCTTTSLSRRLTMHLQNGGPQVHSQTKHDIALTRREIVANTTIPHWVF